MTQTVCSSPHTWSWASQHASWGTSGFDSSVLVPVARVSPKETGDIWRFTGIRICIHCIFPAFVHDSHLCCGRQVQDRTCTSESRQLRQWDTGILSIRYRAVAKNLRGDWGPCESLLKTFMMMHDVFIPEANCE